jgi:hypothetical protein
MPDPTPPADSHGAPRVLTAVIDRIEGPVVLPGGHSWTEGLVIRVPLDRDGRPDWRSAQPDHAETRRRLDDAGETLKRLQQRDLGGDGTP